MWCASCGHCTIDVFSRARNVVPTHSIHTRAHTLAQRKSKHNCCSRSHVEIRHFYFAGLCAPARRKTLLTVQRRCTPSCHTPRGAGAGARVRTFNSVAQSSARLGTRSCVVLIRFSGGRSVGVVDNRGIRNLLACYRSGIGSLLCSIIYQPIDASPLYLC
jgi:hypothetical protein